MILAISRFRISNGTQSTVAEAFANRVGLVDDQPGFLGMEVFTDTGDDALFYLVTRWTDQASFDSWHHSDAHRQSHRGMPRGMKLDKAHTRLFVMNRIAGGTRAGELETAVTDAAPFVAEFFRGAASAFFVEAFADGRIRAWNGAAARRFGGGTAQAAGVCLWDGMGAEDAARLRLRVASGKREPQERFALRLPGVAQALECRLDLRPDGFVLIGEHGSRPDEALLNDMTKMNNELAELSRESARKSTSLEQANQRVTELSRTDAMTGLYNRRHLDEVLATEVTRARRQRSGLAAVMVDLDHFKSVNDRYGHGTGDAVLVAAAAALKAVGRPYDVAARYGGEEFAVLLPGTGLDGALSYAERARSAIQAVSVEGYPHAITASLGVATLAEGEDAHALLGRADAALYRAKQGGRNRVAADAAGPAPLRPPVEIAL